VVRQIDGRRFVTNLREKTKKDLAVSLGLMVTKAGRHQPLYRCKAAAVMR